MQARDWQQESVHVAAGQQQDGQTDTRDSEAASGLQANDDQVCRLDPSSL